jgi:hypothetical protein
VFENHAGRLVRTGNYGLDLFIRFEFLPGDHGSRLVGNAGNHSSGSALHGEVGGTAVAAIAGREGKGGHTQGSNDENAAEHFGFHGNFDFRFSKHVCERKVEANYSNRCNYFSFLH